MAIKLREKWWFGCKAMILIDMVSQVEKHEHMCRKHCLGCVFIGLWSRMVLCSEIPEYFCWVAGDSKRAVPIGSASNNMQGILIPINTIS